MEAVLEQPSIYIVASQTGTLLSRLLKRVTRARFNHVSISMDAQMDTMYSFGRRHPYNPVWGGYIKECPLSGTFARFPETEAKILRVDVTEKQHEDIQRYLERMYRNRKRYHYNYAGLFLGAFRVHFQRKNHYYCSQFVGDVLVRFGVVPPDQFEPIVEPQALLEEIPGSEVIYDGLLTGYPYLSAVPEKQSFLQRLFAA